MKRIAALLLFAAACASGAGPRVATFRADASPAMGEPTIWVVPTRQVLDPLLAKGVVLEQGGRRWVIVSVDWCGIGGSLHTMLRQRMADAASTPLDNVALHTTHTHAAPYIDGDGNRILAEAHRPALLMSDAFENALGDKLAAAVGEAVKRLQPFNQVGTGMAKVERVASARRLILPGGKLVTRYSSTARTPELAAIAEGDIDPYLRTITLAENGKPLVRMHYYASHPQTFCCDGRVSADLAGLAREAVEKSDGVFQIYFTGAAGDVTVGKYNDGTPEARQGLEDRLTAGLRASIAATRYRPAKQIAWRSSAFNPPKKTAPVLAWTKGGPRDDVQDCRTAIGKAFAERTRPLKVDLLDLGGVKMLMLPGEPLLEFQKFALAHAGKSFLAVAGYGEISPGYIYTDLAHQQGGYEPSASYTAPGTEAVLKGVIVKMLR